ncbi:MAG: hypothetical protein ACHWZW_22090 [Spirulina sp.]
MENFPHDLAVNFLNNLAGAVFLLFVQFSVGRFREFKAPYSGLWEGCILDGDGQIIKRDDFFFKQQGSKVIGSIRRKYPNTQANRRWLFQGKIEGREMVAIFWRENRGIMSYGSWYVRQIEDDKFVGFYLNLACEEDAAMKFIDVLEPINVTLSKKPVKRFDYIKQFWSI